MFLLALSFTLAFIHTALAAVVSDITCVPITQCTSFDRLVKNKPIKPEALQFLLSSSCGFEGKVHKVWCPKIDTKETPDTTDAPATDVVSNRVELPEDECGRQVEDKIVGGTATGIDEFPWMAVLQYKQRESDELVAKCAGALITNRYVLTAAHCITRAGKPASIVLGDYHIVNETDCVLSTFGDEECAPAPIRLIPEDIIIHPGWEAKDQRPFYDDIALIRLSAPVEFTDFVRPICLPKPNKAIAGEKNYTVAGWGITEKKRRSNIKLKVQVPSTTREYCTKVLKREIKDGQICAGGLSNQDSCKGDSGGPLMSVNLDTGLWVTTGIVSLGTRSCGIEGIPAIYTYVPNYVDWIIDNMKP